jgi:hypothetical protein
MKVKLYAFAAIAVFLLALTTTTDVYTNSALAPPGKAGDPTNNATCANGSGCHGTSTLDGTNVISLKIGTTAGAQSVATSSFVPTANTTYFMTVDLTGSVQKYGFSVTALNADTNTPADSFTITNANQTFLHSNFNGVNYVAHKSASATKSWIYKWTAPATISGPINFYVTANLANGNGNETGDAIYKKVVSINGSTSVEDISSLASVSLFPNPANENVTINYSLLNNEFVTAQIINEEGKVVKSLFGENQNVGVLQSSHNISDLAAGKYLMHISAAGKSTVKPFVKY